MKGTGKKITAIVISAVLLIAIMKIAEKHDKENITTSKSAGIVSNISEQQVEETTGSNKLQETITNTELKQLYESFLKYYASQKSWTYAYYDSDEDGQEELYILLPTYENEGGYIVRHEKNGLHLYLEIEFSPQICNSLVWNLMPGGENGSGIEVYADQEKYSQCHYWFEDEESFLSGFGFDESQLIYEYRDVDDIRRLLLYFDEESGEGCGIRYGGNNGEYQYGFTFDDAVEEEWTGFLTDFNKQISIYGSTGDDYVDDYQEEFVYDSEGRLIKYVSTGLFDDRTEGETILEFHYEYYDNDVLKYRYYYHNPCIFGTTSDTRDSYFDELGRVEYEQAYITHGSLEYYYIYSELEQIPRYVLLLDDNLGAFIPEFTCY